MRNDLRGKVVLITGGTRGIGRAMGLAFGKLGAICALTHKWGSADENELRRSYANCGAPEPILIEADAARDQDTQTLLTTLREHHAGIDIFISNVAFADVTASPAQYTRRGLLASIEYTAWPLVAYTEKIRDIFGAPPKYVIGLSSIGPDRYIANYDMIACSKAVLETLARYLAHHYASAGTRVNVVRAGIVRTESLEATLGGQKLEAIRSDRPDAFMTTDEIAHSVVALCSGWMDAVTGQVITVDRGQAFSHGAGF
ncbi:SDR family oxidoreductase [Bradyrhizobium genosp. A]|uniref:SDR family oxidoreductase n=1 Tax=Bradyrhizobium genosp. A TaxID=83626 RepID=UPI003CE8FE98